MHELPVTEGIFKMAKNAAENAGASKIYSITLKMGEGCDYVPEIIQQYFDMMSAGTIAEGAIIKENLIPTQILCRDCGSTFPKTYTAGTCSICGSSRLVPKISSECYIETMEIESED